jgi:hypothetical protein
MVMGVTTKALSELTRAVNDLIKAERAHHKVLEQALEEDCRSFEAIHREHDGLHDRLDEIEARLVVLAQMIEAGRLVHTEG